MLTCVFSSLSFADYREKPPTGEVHKIFHVYIAILHKSEKNPEKPRISLTHKSIILYSDIN